MAQIAPVLAHLDAGRDAALARLFELVRCQSISTDPAYAPECRRAAEWLAADLAGIGFAARVVDTEGHPLVLAEAGEGGPHVLFYGHYDVQPVDPLDLWDQPPFEPQLVTRPDGSKAIHGRGTADDKGQLMTFIEAARAHMAVHGRLPCRVTILLEGEEESAGEAIATYLRENADALRADVVAVCDTNMWDAETPAICTMLRGMTGAEVTVRGPSRDLHSGYFGGAAINPIRVLAQALAGLHDADGSVTLKGFYDGVPTMPEDVMAGWRSLGFDTGRFLGEVGLAHPAGEANRSGLEQIWSRPTAEVNGIWGGYTGAGFKTVIPAEAHAKVSFRLVGDQDPNAVFQAFCAHMEAAMPPDCTVEVEAHGASPATMMETGAPAFQKAREALTAEWEREAVFVGVGGSIPIVQDFKSLLGCDPLLVGFGHAEDRIHSPNETYSLTSFTKGCRSWARILAALAD